MQKGSDSALLGCGTLGETRQSVAVPERAEVPAKLDRHMTAPPQSDTHTHTHTHTHTQEQVGKQGGRKPGQGAAYTEASSHTHLSLAVS